MQPLWLNLKEHEREIVFYAVNFLTDRMEELATIEWALSLKSKDTIKRNAILWLIDNQIEKISEPWRSAWRLIEEYWATPEIDNDSLSLKIAERIGSSDKSGATVKSIVDFVAPRLKLESINKWASISGIKIPKKPKRVDQIFAMSLTSGNLISTGSGWSEQDPAFRAESWIKQQQNYEKIIVDLELSDNAESNFPRVWDKFCRTHLTIFPYSCP